MKKNLFALLLVSCAIHYSCTQTQNITTVNLPSEELNHHILGEISTHDIGVYLPPSYANSTTKYPVLYFLPGYSCGYFNKNALIRNYQRAIKSGTVKEMIVVFIDGCTTNSYGSFYMNSEAGGNWDDFITSNVVPYIDSHYRTLAQRNSRAIAGHSMGGFGAIHLAMLHPDVFSSVYSHSPGLFSKTGLEDSQMFKNTAKIEAYIALEKELAVMSKEEAHIAYLNKLSGMNEDLRFTIEYGMAVAPNVTKNAPYTDFPYIKTDGALVKNDALWKKWESGFGGFNTKVPQYKTNFMDLDTIVIDYGTNDSYSWIPKGCQYVSNILSSNNVPHKLLSYVGRHSNLNRYSNIMFPLLTDVLTFHTD